MIPREFLGAVIGSNVVSLGLVLLAIRWPRLARVLFALIFLLVVLAGLLLNKVMPGESAGLVMEMFPFRAPSLANVLKKTWLRVKDFLAVAAPLIVAGSLLATLPTLLVFFGLQRYFIQGLTLGATKG